MILGGKPLEPYNDLRNLLIASQVHEGKENKIFATFSQVSVIHDPVSPVIL